MFASDRSGNYDIWLRKENGDLIQITENPSNEIQPVFSNDKSNIIFVSDRTGNKKLWGKELVSGDETQLTDNSAVDEMPDYSPVENKIVFVSDRTGNKELWLLDLDSKEEMQLTNNKAENLEPEFLSNGKQIIFSLIGSLYLLDLNDLSINPVDFSIIKNFENENTNDNSLLENFNFQGAMPFEKTLKRINDLDIILVWSSKNEIKNEKKIYFAMSKDNGKSWLPKQEFSMCQGCNFNAYNLVVLSDGNLIVITYTRFNIGSPQYNAVVNYCRNNEKDCSVKENWETGENGVWLGEYDSQNKEGSDIQFSSAFLNDNGLIDVLIPDLNSGKMEKYSCNPYELDCSNSNNWIKTITKFFEPTPNPLGNKIAFSIKEDIDNSDIYFVELSDKKEVELIKDSFEKSTDSYLTSHFLSHS